MPAVKTTKKTTSKGSLKGLFLKESVSQPEEINVSQMISPVASIKVIGCG
jgi:hypothetical protein